MFLRNRVNGSSEQTQRRRVAYGMPALWWWWVGDGSAEISGGEIWDSKRPQQPQSSLSEQRAYITRPQQQTYSFLEHCLKTRSKTRTQTGIRMSYDRFLPPQTASTAPSNQRRTTIVLPTQLRQI